MSDLSYSAGVLSPEFDAETYDYTLTISQDDISDATVTAVKSDEDIVAEVYLDGVFVTTIPAGQSEWTTQLRSFSVGKHKSETLFKLDGKMTILTVTTIVEPSET